MVGVDCPGRFIGVYTHSTKFRGEYQCVIDVLQARVAIVPTVERLPYHAHQPAKWLLGSRVNQFTGISRTCSLDRWASDSRPTLIRLGGLWTVDSFRLQIEECEIRTSSLTVSASMKKPSKPWCRPHQKQTISSSMYHSPLSAKYGFIVNL